MVAMIRFGGGASKWVLFGMWQMRPDVQPGSHAMEILPRQCLRIKAQNGIKLFIFTALGLLGENEGIATFYWLKTPIEDTGRSEPQQYFGVSASASPKTLLQGGGQLLCVVSVQIAGR